MKVGGCWEIEEANIDSLKVEQILGGSSFINF